MPSAGNSLFPANPASIFDATPEERQAEFERRWARGGPGLLGSFREIMTNKEANDMTAEFVRGKIRQTVTDPHVADLLSPRQVIGCKRICLDTDYYETFNRGNVHLVDVSAAPIETLTPAGLRTGGTEYELDAIVFATGFDAMTGALLGMDIRGRDGLALADAWAAGPRTYLGLGVPGFPNMFIITGPGSPSVLTSMLGSIHQHVTWTGDCLAYLRTHAIASIEATAEAADGWVGHVNSVADQTLYPTCNSWYLGANIPGKTRVFMPLIGFPSYAEKCAKVAANGYEGFVLARAVAGPGLPAAAVERG
jgi:cyclohexanone monooxygenase